MPVDELSLEEMRDGAEVAATIAAASEAGLFDGLADRPAMPSALAARLGLDTRATAIMLAALADIGLLEDRDGEYALTNGARRRFADPSSPDYVADGLPLWLHNLAGWTELPTVLQTGGPITEGETEEDEESLAHFMAAMAAAPAERVQRVVERCLERRPDAESALDLGGGPGHFARAFAAQGLDTTLFDTPETIDYVADAYGLADVGGLRLARGDFIEDPLPEGPFDVVLASNIAHIYSPDQNVRLLTKVRDVLAPGGVVAIGDFVRGRSPRAARFALVMLLRTERGNTYSEREYRNWLRELHFEDIEVDDVDTDRQLVTAVRG